MRDVLGSDGHIMSDFNQGLSLGDALQRCHGLDDQGLYWFEEPIAYDDLAGYARLTRELRTPVMLGENFYGARVARGDPSRRRRLSHAGFDADRRRHRLAWPRRSPAPPASSFPPTCTPRWRAICCASPRPATGWSGRTGRIPSWRNRSRCRTASS